MENQLTEKKSIIHFSLNLKCFAVAVVLLILLTADIFKPVNYVDEAVGVLSIAVLVLALLTGKIDSFDRRTLLLLSAAVIITFLANAVFNINPSIVSVLVDALTQVKAFVAFFALRYLLNDKERQTIIQYISPLAIAFLILAFLFSIINQIADIGMGGGYRYGIKIFKFIYSFNHQYAASAIFLFGTVICNDRLNRKAKRAISVFAIIAILSALKTLSVIFPAMWLTLLYYFSRRRKMNFFTILLAFILIVLLSRYQINEYLLDTSSPRRVFFDYAKVDANSHFPLGSGFGTYGSAEAAKNYSRLYYQYGFQNRWGMSPDYKAFLHDNYWQGVIGQFGWIGFAMIIICYARIIICAVSLNSAPQRRAYQIATVVAILVLALGSASITSSTGMICFSAFSLTSEKSNLNKRNKSIPKIRIKT
jgi:hypothetical protein